MNLRKNLDTTKILEAVATGILIIIDKNVAKK